MTINIFMVPRKGKSGSRHMPAEFQVQKKAAHRLVLQTALNGPKSTSPRVRVCQDSLSV